MCRALSGSDALSVAFQTVSCDRRHRDAKAMQCGRCSSCILRRLAFSAAGVPDGTPYIYGWEESLHQNTITGSNDIGNHIPGAHHQYNVMSRALASPHPWRSLVSRYESLSSEVVDRTSEFLGISPQAYREGLVQLLGRYAHEWEIMLS